ncbi:MAG TPA: hypothetical protein VLA66_12395 [Thermoanaerobaculia bacterium]|nr:hypothetical protein [Thermoanaerobaculia bacterium]
MWDLLFDFRGLLERGIDAAAYGFLALSATVLFLVRLGFAMFGGDSGDGDFGGDADLDAGSHSDVTFSLFSLLSILAFFMGTGWMGLACRLDWGLGRFPSALLATGFGLVMMITASAMMWGVRRLNREVGYDLGTAVGKAGRVYLTIPEKGAGHGQVEVTVSGRKKVLRAASAGPRLEAFRDVRVVSFRAEDETLVVEPLD